ncbi:putative dTMP kinase [Burkholderia pseudomallei MSHR5596]|nr:putative dTMP kinase [Burkholderia pseudomallei MSHR5596]
MLGFAPTQCTHGRRCRRAGSALPGVACVCRRPPDRRGDGGAGRVAGLGPSPSGTEHRAPGASRRLGETRSVPLRIAAPPAASVPSNGRLSPAPCDHEAPDATAARVAARKRTALSASAAHAPTRDAVSMLPPFRTAGTRVAGRPAPPTNAPPRGR